MLEQRFEKGFCMGGSACNSLFQKMSVALIKIIYLETTLLKSKLHQLIDLASDEELIELDELIGLSAVNDGEYMQTLHQRMDEINSDTAQLVSWESVQMKAAAITARN